MTLRIRLTNALSIMAPNPRDERTTAHAANPPRMAAHNAKHAQIKTVLAAWHVWQGSTETAVARHRALDAAATLPAVIAATTLNDARAVIAADLVPRADGRLAQRAAS